jgi:hypothetical protein
MIGKTLRLAPGKVPEIVEEEQPPARGFPSDADMRTAYLQKLKAEMAAV